MKNINFWLDELFMDMDGDIHDQACVPYDLSMLDQTFQIEFSGSVYDPR